MGPCDAHPLLAPPPTSSAAPWPAGEHYHKKQEQGSTNDWYVQYSIDLKYGADCCSPQSISFSALSEDGTQLRRTDALVNACQN